MGIDPDLQPYLDDINRTLVQLRADLNAVQDGLAAQGSAIVNLDARHDVDINALNTRIDLLGDVVTPPPPPPPTWQPEFPGDVKPGTIRWGCSFQSNGVPSAHEAAAGVSVGVRRTFWRLDQATKIVDTAKADIAAGRVPWVSVKLTSLASWKQAAAGQVDDHLANLFVRLGALGGAVWFTAHHEPEGGNGTPYPDEGQGSEVHWRAMQQRVRQVLDGTGVTNVAFAPILMAWTFSPSSGRNPADWWVDGIWDFAGIDNYVEASATTVRTQGWDNAVKFYGDRGLRIGVGEWGNKDHGDSGASEMRSWYDHLVSVGSPGACYFDTNLNGGVPLSGAALEEFRRLMNDPRSVRLPG